MCAQDCFGNGNLFLGNYDTIGPNCSIAYINIVDTIKPVFQSGCGTTSSLRVGFDCLANMPNLSSTILARDGCSGVSIYQYPAPGSILNDGIDGDFGLASGSARAYTCAAIKAPDNMVQCQTSGQSLIKNIEVSFIFVDCNGNCTVKQNCQSLTLLPPLSRDSFSLNTISSLEIRSSNSVLINNSSDIKMTNFPNPFSHFTEIKITSDINGDGHLNFFNVNGQRILSKNVRVYKGATLVRLDKCELNASRLVFYSLELKNQPIGSVNLPLRNKMILY